LIKTDIKIEYKEEEQEYGLYYKFCRGKLSVKNLINFRNYEFFKQKQVELKFYQAQLKNYMENINQVFI
jgi:hypothetical protein